MEPETEFEKHGIVPNVVFPTGAVVRDRQLIVYYGGADRISCVASAPIDKLLEELRQGG